MNRLPETITIPGAVDLHVHFREPGTNKAETFASGSKAALKGGFVLVCDMPNNPGRPTWSVRRLKDKHQRIKKSAYIPVLTYAGSQPEKNNIDELEKMAQYSVGLKLYSSATTGNQKEYNARDFEEIVRKWHEVAPDKPIMLHSGAGNVYGFIRLIARKYQHQLHVCHVNSVREVRFISKAKNRGLPVTCGICPHHLFLTSHNEVTQGWFARMQPPLAKEKETEELFRLFVEGAIDILETDHAPHQIKNKWAAEEGEGACYGVPGIEFALPLLFYQMKQKRITLRRIIEATSTKPAQIIGVKLPTKTTVTWKMQPYRINESMVSSKSGWSPFNGMLAVGRVEEVTIGGKSIVKSGQIRTKVSGLALN